MTKKSQKRSADPASQAMLAKADAAQQETAWDRWDAMQPQCGFGSLGICCRICSMGPCRIDPFSEELGNPFLSSLETLFSLVPVCRANLTIFFIELECIH